MRRKMTVWYVLPLAVLPVFLTLEFVGFVELLQKQQEKAFAAS